MPGNPSVSFILPVYGHTSSLDRVIAELKLKLSSLNCGDYKLLVYDVREIGEAFTLGVMGSNTEYVGIYSAYDQIDPKSLEFIIPALGKADVVVGYIANTESRSWPRRFLSKANIILANLFFGLKLKYYHFCFFRTDLAKRVKISSSSHAAMTETVVWLIRSGATFIQVPIFLKPHNFSSKSGAFKITNLTKIFLAYLRLFVLTRIMRQKLVL